MHAQYLDSIRSRATVIQGAEQSTGCSELPLERDLGKPHVDLRGLQRYYEPTMNPALRSCITALALAMPVQAAETGEVATTTRATTSTGQPERAVVRPYLFGSLGMGFPELVNAQLGVYLHPRVTLDAVYGWVLFNHMLGGGLTGYFFGTPRRNAPPGHTLTLSGYIRNNVARPLGSDTAGETIGVTAEMGLGYAYHAAFGLRVTGQVGGFISPNHHAISGGPLLRLSAGWVFPFGSEPN